MHRIMGTVNGHRDPRPECGRSAPMRLPWQLRGTLGHTRQMTTRASRCRCFIVPGLGLHCPHLCRDWARPCHICTGSRLMLGARFASQRLCCIASLAAVAGAFQVATGLRDWRRGGLRRGRVFLGRWVRGALRAKQLHLHHGQRSEPTYMCARARRCPRPVAGLWRLHASDCRRAT